MSLIQSVKLNGDSPYRFLKDVLERACKSTSATASPVAHMIPCLVQLYLDSATRLCRLEKVVEFHAMPRVGEWLKLSNLEMGDYFGFRVAEVTHREGCFPELMLARLQPSDGHTSAFDDAELEEYLASYVACGWKHASTVKNPDTK